MELNKIHRVFFLGIGGIGMSAIARWFLSKGCRVAGYDKTATELTQNLSNEGAEIFYEDSIELFENVFTDSKDVFIVYTPAIPKDSLLLNYFQDQKYVLRKRAEVLGIITKNYFTIAVAGTHGKTTTSTLVAHLLKQCGKNVTAFLGGISKNFESNLLLGDFSKEMIVVVEADEYDRSFLQLSPNVAIITTTDPDHLDIYNSKSEFILGFVNFIDLLPDTGVLIRNTHVDHEVQHQNTLDYNYSHPINGVSNVVFEHGFQQFNIPAFGNVDFKTKVPGIHNMENCVAAILACVSVGCAVDDLAVALSDFKGVNRRFEYRVINEKITYIDDYAHHPSEIEMTLLSAKSLYPNKKITVVFQPHLFSRTRDFMDAFAASLSLADELYLLDIYPAREKPIVGVTSDVLFDKITIKNKKILKKEDLIASLDLSQVELLFTLGAGDIDTLIKPIEKLINEN